MRSFVLDQPAYRVIFGIGSIERLPEEVRKLGATRALVVSTPAEIAFAEDAAGNVEPRPHRVRVGPLLLLDMQD